MVWFKVCFVVEEKDKFLMLKMVYLVKHYGLKKCIIAKLRINVGQFYMFTTNTKLMCKIKSCLIPQVMT
jgi:hypothetical protein